ncbi:MAG TPA: hypothetical protein VK528_05875 [Flavobacterium sp.]|nr:hypothetical protein [Flavobacterium sp.]
MKINPKNGIGQLLFGMKKGDVAAIFGNPDKEYKDEDENLIQTYNTQKLRLTFYMEEDFRLGYIIGAAADLELFDHKIIGRKPEEVQNELKAKGLLKWTKEAFDTYENWFNEDYWIVLQTEFGEVVKFELGAIINDQDEFDWKFKGK